MKNAPKWTPEFLEKCAVFEKFMGWGEGIVVSDLINAIELASRGELEDGMRNGYLYLLLDDGDYIDLGPSYKATIDAMTIHRDDMTNWDEFISTRLTMFLLGGECDEG